MIKILSSAAMAAMILLAWSANGATAVQKAPAKKTAAKKKAAPGRKSGSASTSKKGTGTVSAHKSGTASRTAASRGKKTPVKRVTWRNRQMAPSADRYREIQGALAAKGFLAPGDANGTWNQTSADALKKFQAEQNLESSGKINSLSLIALGLGPKHDAAPSAPKPPPPAQ